LVIAFGSEKYYSNWKYWLKIVTQHLSWKKTEFSLDFGF
jgi:hypothetical protein